MPHDMFTKYGLNKIHDSFVDDQDFKDNNVSQWKFIKSKSVMDSDGFMTDYTWYTNGTKHIFMFGDSDLYDPDEDYADWTTDNQQEAEEWFNSYTGFSDEDDWEEDDYDDTYTGNSNFMNEGFNRVYGVNIVLED